MKKLFGKSAQRALLLMGGVGPQGKSAELHLSSPALPGYDCQRCLPLPSLLPPLPAGGPDLLHCAHGAAAGGHAGGAAAAHGDAWVSRLSTRLQSLSWRLLCQCLPVCSQLETNHTPHTKIHFVRPAPPACCRYKVIAFFPTARLTQFMAELANAAGIPALEIHSRKSQVGCVLGGVVGTGSWIWAVWQATVVVLFMG